MLKTHVRYIVDKDSKGWKKQVFSSPGQHFQLESEALSILVFKTSLETKEDIAQINPQLEFLPNIKEWSVDNDDPDNVLRVMGRDLKAEKIIAVVKAGGYECEVLP